MKTTHSDVRVRLAKGRRSRGFTLTEILVGLGLVAVAVGATVYTNLGLTRSQGVTASGTALQGSLSSSYSSWTSSGGSHTASTTHDIAHEAQFAYDIISTLSGAPGVNAANPSHFATTGVADGSSSLIPASNSVRINLQYAVSDPGTSSTTGVQYGPFYVLFEPTSGSTGIWQVTTAVPTAIP